MPFLLLSDIHSHVTPSVKYGSRFDPVTIISRSGHVLILELRKGHRFATNEGNVIEVSAAEMKRVMETNAVLVELQSKNNTPANVVKVKKQEEKILTILNK